MGKEIISTITTHFFTTDKEISSPQTERATYFPNYRLSASIEISIYLKTFETPEFSPSPRKTPGTYPYAARTW